MDKEALKNVIYGGLIALASDRTLYYRGIGPQYSHWTENGQEALQSFLDIMTYQMLKVEESEMDRRAKELVVKGLKGEKV